MIQSMWMRTRALWAGMDRRWRTSRLRWPINVLSIVLMVPLWVWLAAWWFSQDVSMHPELEAVLRLEPPVDDPGNAYFSLVGLRANGGSDAHRVGSLVVMMVFDRLQRGDAIADDQSLVAFLGDPERPIEALPAVCVAGRDACLAPMKAQSERTKQWLRAHQAVWQEYLYATRLPRYVDMVPGAQSVADTVTFFSEAARFVVASYWANAQAEDAFGLLERSVRFCRAVLEGTVALPVKMAAQACIQYGWALAAQMVLEAPQPVLQRVKGSLDELARPVLQYQMAFRSVIKARVGQGLDRLLNTPHAQKVAGAHNVWLSILIRPFFLRNKMLNQFFEQQMAQVAYDQMTSAELARETERPAAQPRGAQRWWSWLRSGNPVGAWLLDEAPQTSWLPYVLRVRALESQRRLLLLARHCVQEKWLPIEPQACASSAPEAMRNPFDGAAPVWMPSERALQLPVTALAWDQSVAMPMLRLRE